MPGYFIALVVIGSRELTEAELLDVYKRQGVDVPGQLWKRYHMEKLNCLIEQAIFI